MPPIKRIVILAAIATATAVSVPGTAGAWGSSGIAGAAPTAGAGSRSGSTSYADLHAAQIAATHASATLDQFSLIHLHHIPPSTTAVIPANSDPNGFQFGDAAIGAGAMAGLVLLGSAGATTVRRRRQLHHT